MSADRPSVNPTDRWCWVFCPSCNRCQDKGRYTKCNGCSGRYDPELIIKADSEDFCDCKNGTLRWKTQQGKLVMTKFKSNPFKSQVKYEKKSDDERDWDSYVKDMREKLNDPNWDPITYYED
jgi:hypothetical protein